MFQKIVIGIIYTGAGVIAGAALGCLPQLVGLNVATYAGWGAIIGAPIGLYVGYKHKFA